MKIRVFAILIILMMLPFKIASQNNNITIINDSTISITVVTVDTIQKDSTGIYNLYRSPLDSLNFYYIIRKEQFSELKNIYITSNDTSYIWGNARKSFPDKLTPRYFTVGGDSLSIVWGIDTLTLCVKAPFISNDTINEDSNLKAENSLDDKNSQDTLLWMLLGSVLFVLIVVFCLILIGRKKIDNSSSGDEGGTASDNKNYFIEDEAWLYLACRNYCDNKYEDAQKCLENISSALLEKEVGKLKCLINKSNSKKNKSEDKSDGKNITISSFVPFENRKSDVNIEEYNDLKYFKNEIVKYAYEKLNSDNENVDEDIKLGDVLEMLNKYFESIKVAEDVLDLKLSDDENNDARKLEETYSDKEEVIEKIPASTNNFKKELDEVLNNSELIELVKNKIKEGNPENVTSLLNKINELFVSNVYLKDVCKNPNSNQRAILFVYVKTVLKDWFGVNLSSEKSDDIMNNYVLKFSGDLDNYCLEKLNKKIKDKSKEYKSFDELANDLDNHQSGDLSGSCDNVNIRDVQREIIGNVGNCLSEIFKENDDVNKQIKEISESAGTDQFNLKLADLLKSVADKLSENAAVFKDLNVYGSDAINIKSGIQLETLKEIGCYLSKNFKDNQEINDKVGKISKSENIDQFNLELQELLTSILSTLQAEREKMEVLNSKVSNKYKVIFSDDLQEGKRPVEEFVSKTKEVIDNKNKEIASILKEKTAINEQLKEKTDFYTVIFNECINSVKYTFDKINNSILDTCDSDLSNGIADSFRKYVLENDGYSLDKLKEEFDKICVKANEEKDYESFKSDIIELFCNLLGRNSWIHALTRMFLYVQQPKIAEKFEESGLFVHEIERAFILTEYLFDSVGIKLEYPQLFKDWFDESNYDNRSLADINKIVGASLVTELVGNRPKVIIDLHRVGFKIGDRVSKPTVSIFS